MAVIGEVRTSDMLGKDLKLVRDLHTLSADVIHVPGARRIAARASGTWMRSGFASTGSLLAPSRVRSGWAP